MNVSLIAAISVDGFISPVSKSNISSTSWTSKEDNHFFQEKTEKIGAIIMGRKTYDTIPDNHRPLKNRLNIIYTSQPTVVENSVPLSKYNSPDTAYQHLAITTDKTPKNLLTELSNHGINQIAICGGSSIYTQFLKANLVQDIFLTIEPVIFGSGIPLFDNQLDTKLKLNKITDLSNQTKVLHYKVIS